MLHGDVSTSLKRRHENAYFICYLEIEFLHVVEVSRICRNLLNASLNISVTNEQTNL